MSVWCVCVCIPCTRTMDEGTEDEKNRSAKTTSGTKDRTRKLVSKLYTSFISCFRHRVNGVCVCRHSDYLFFFHSLSSKLFDVVLFLCVWWWSIPLCLQIYICVCLRGSNSSTITPRAAQRRREEKMKTYKSHQIKFISCFFFVEVIKSLLLLHIISWACAWTSMMSGEQRSLVLSICWWIFNKLSSALCGEQITIIIRWDLFRITRYFFFHF